MERSRIWPEEMMRWKRPTEKCDRKEVKEVSGFYWPRLDIIEHALRHETAYILCVPSSILSSMSRFNPSTSQNPFPRHSTQPSQPSTPNLLSCPFTALLYQLYSASILGAVECRDKARWKVDSDDGEGRSE